MYSTRPQRMGSGTTTRYIEAPIQIFDNAAYYDAQTELLNSAELMNYCAKYQYMKIEKINVVLMPTSKNAEVLLYPVWNNETNVTNNDMMYNDSVKRLATHTIRYQKRTFLPPKITATLAGQVDGITKYSAINLWTYNQTDNYMVKSTTNKFNFPFKLFYYGTIEDIIEARIIFKCKFRGQKYTEELNKLIEYKDDEVIKKRIEELEKIKREKEREKISDKIIKTKISQNQNNNIISESFSSITSDSHSKPELTKDKLIEFMNKNNIKCKLPPQFSTTYLILQHIKSGAVENKPENILNLVEFLKKFYLDKRELKMRYGLEDNLGQFINNSMIENKINAKELKENDDKRMNILLEKYQDKIVQKAVQKIQKDRKNNVSPEELKEYKCKALKDILMEQSEKTMYKDVKEEIDEDLKMIDRTLSNAYSSINSKNKKKRQKMKFSSL